MCHAGAAGHVNGGQITGVIELAWNSDFNGAATMAASLF